MIDRRPGLGTPRPPRRRRGGTARGRAPGAGATTALNAVVDLMAARIERALAMRTRYRYVTPRVQREGAGWAVFSPNCSRNVRPDGGEIAIAWLLPVDAGLWRLHARDHAGGTWRIEAAGLPLDDALASLCADTARVFWV